MQFVCSWWRRRQQPSYLVMHLQQSTFDLLCSMWGFEPSSLKWSNAKKYSNEWWCHICFWWYGATSTITWCHLGAFDGHPELFPDSHPAVFVGSWFTCERIRLTSTASRGEETQAWARRGWLQHGDSARFPAPCVATETGRIARGKLWFQRLVFECISMGTLLEKFLFWTLIYKHLSHSEMMVASCMLVFLMLKGMNKGIFHLSLLTHNVDWVEGSVIFCSRGITLCALCWLRCFDFWGFVFG